MKSKIGIFGIGAIGSVITLNLNDENEYFYFNRSDKNSIEVAFEKEHFHKEITLSKVEKRDDLDWLIICLKEYHFSTAQADLKKLIGEKTKVAVIRNGLNLKESVSAFVNEEKIVECMIDCPVQETVRGKYRLINKPKITIEKNELSVEFESLFEKEKVEIYAVEDYLTANWKKVIESSAIGGILALSGETSWIFKDNDLLNLYKKVVEEGILVAEKEGAKIEKAFVETLVKKLKNYPETKGSSMLTDRLNGHPIEINAKNGIISNYGKKHEIATEMNDVISTLLKYTNNKKA